MGQTARILERALRRKKQSANTLDGSKIFLRSTSIDTEEGTAAQDASRKDAATAQLCRNVADAEISSALRGAPPKAFSVFIEALEPITNDGDSVLEIGCSCGFGAEVLEYLLPRRLAYTGIDCSEAMVAVARDYYPEKVFMQGPPTAIPLDSNTFDVTISSGPLSGLTDPEETVKEAARLSKRHIVFHRTLICRERASHISKRSQHNEETQQHTFNESEFLSMLERHGARLVNGIISEENSSGDCYECTYVFRKLV
jgi:SAM-dependent methyltransferase